MNTVFKVYYQVWILLAVLGAVGWAQGCTRPGRASHFFKGLLLLVLIPGNIYALRLTKEALQPDASRSLHAWSSEAPRTRILLNVSNHLIQPGDGIVEAPGISYDPGTSQLGTWTAGDTLIGWAGHQNQWRPGEPHPDPLPLYRAQSEAELDALLAALAPQWILWSREERSHVTPHPEWEFWMDQRADRVVNDPNRVLFRVRN